MIRPWQPPPPTGPPYEALLSRREAQVLDLLCGGLADKEIAATLWISLQTVKSHNKRIYRSLGVHDRCSAVAAVLSGRCRVHVNDREATDA